MGAELCATYLEIQKGKEPDFGAAAKHLETMSPEDMIAVVEEIVYGHCELETEDEEKILYGKKEETIDPDDGAEEYAQAVVTAKVDELGEKKKAAALLARSRLEESLKEVVVAWDLQRRGITVLYLDKTNLLLCADMTYGDPPDGYADIQLFLESGMAEAAGFITRKDKP